MEFYYINKSNIFLAFNQNTNICFISNDFNLFLSPTVSCVVIKADIRCEYSGSSSTATVNPTFTRLSLCNQSLLITRPGNSTVTMCHIKLLSFEGDTHKLLSKQRKNILVTKQTQESAHVEIGFVEKASQQWMIFHEFNHQRQSTADDFCLRNV